MVVGYLLAWATVMLPPSAKAQPLIVVPTLLYYGLGFDWNLLVPLMLVFMVTSIKTIGDITSTSDVSEQPVRGPLYDAAPERRRVGQRPELHAVCGVQHLSQLLLWPKQRRHPTHRRRQPQPHILQFAPQWLKTLLSSGIAAGGITAIILNILFPPEEN